MIATGPKITKSIKTYYLNIKNYYLNKSQWGQIPPLFRSPLCIWLFPFEILLIHQ